MAQGARRRSRRGRARRRDRSDRRRAPVRPLRGRRRAAVLGNAMAVDLARLQVASGHSPRLARRDPADRLGLSGKTATREQRDALLDELEELHRRLWAEAERSVLLVLQGVDTSGKDGVIRRALSGLNPQGCAVTSFKTPTTLELERDYLWRVDKAPPPPRARGGVQRSPFPSGPPPRG